MSFVPNEIQYADEPLAFSQNVVHASDKAQLSPGAVWIIDFYSPWCPTCHALAPQFSRLADVFAAVEATPPLAIMLTHHPHAYNDPYHCLRPCLYRYPNPD